MSKEIDYLFEDPAVSGQQFALVSIVGPNMNQKCSVWGLKVRGTCDSVEKARSMTKKLLKIDPDYDIYTVEVGKFFPLQVEPNEISDVEYQNDALNKLVKGYLENREAANDQWHERKRELMKKAIEEGKNQEELNAKPEHPVAVLQRMKQFESVLEELTEKVEVAKRDLQMTKSKFDEMYTEEEKEIAIKELESEIKDVKAEVATEMSIEEIRQKLAQDL